MADFDGGVFVGVDDGAFGDGASGSTEFLDSLVEAALRSQEYYNIVGYDEFGWDAHVATWNRNSYTETRPKTSLEWTTIAPPLWIPVLPYLTAIEVKGDYSVGDQGGGSAEDFDARIDLVGFGSKSFTMANTQVATPYWAAFDETLNVRGAQNLTWTQLQFWGRGRLGTAVINGDGEPVYGNAMRDLATTYSQGTGTMPNSTSPEVQVTAAIDLLDQVAYYDHLHYDDAIDAMVLTPPMIETFRLKGVDVYSISYVQLRGLTVRMRYEVEK